VNQPKKPTVKKELEELLYRRYPALFVEKTLSPQESGMCWGLACGDGWFDLIDTLCSTIQFGIDQGYTPPVRIRQVKEKFGTLRFHTRGGNEWVRGAVEMAMACSVLIHEE
jgi:hypothetical protein